ncbi:MAG TPA: response regulator transcription factor [Candidatus Dormibacteraeota bacterium]
MAVADLRLLIVSSNRLARGGMAAIVGEMPGVRAIGSAALSEAESLAGQLHPEVVLLDVGEGQLEDLDAIVRLTGSQPGLPIVAVGGDAERVAQSLAQALALGASALLPATVDLETLRLALLASTHGLVTIARADIGALLPADEALEPALTATTESLTGRELEVLQLMAGGLTNRQIAGRLKISEHTVKFHAGGVLSKLNARSRTEAVARAAGLGWILV